MPAPVAPSSAASAAASSIAASRRTPPRAQEATAGNRRVACAPECPSSIDSSTGSASASVNGRVAMSPLAAVPSVLAYTGELLLRPSEPAESGSSSEQQRAARSHQTEVEPGEREPAARLDGLRTESLLHRALDTHVRVALKRSVPQRTLQIGLRVVVIQPTVVLVIPVDL